MKNLVTTLLLAVAETAVFAQAPAIVRQPADATIFYGDPVTFSVTPTGGAPLYYQWYRDGDVLPAGTGSTWTISMVRSNEAGAKFWVRVTNSLGSATSAVATLTVDFGSLGAAQTNRVMAMTHSWRYNISTNDLLSAWVATGYPDSGWPAAPALLWQANDSRTSTITGGPLSTRLPLTPGALPTTCYFRTHFTNPAPASAAVALSVTTVVDDGVVAYLNGSDAFRLGITNVPASFTNYANRVVGDPAAEGPAPFLADALVPGDNVIAAEVHQANATSSDITWGMTLDAVIAPRFRDTNAPTVVKVVPAVGTTVPVLTQFEVHFSEGVKGVTAGSLRINGAAATNVTAYSTDVYVFDFPSPAPGAVQITWSPGQAITDLSANSNRFAGGSYACTYDPTMSSRQVRINEFMASNGHTIRDDDGQNSDWIELYNASAQTVNIGGWYLTDDPARPAKWQFPAGVQLLSKAYLLVWASGQDRTNLAAPLHTSFRLSKSAGSSLQLIYLDGRTIMSGFSPYPEQYQDVSYGCDQATPTFVGYFTNATPGFANATVGPGFGPIVDFSVPGGTFRQGFSLSLSTADPTATIRYLLVTNGASASVNLVPDQNSPVYTGPIPIANSIQVRARAFSSQANFFPGPARNETYVQIAASAASFSSDLPIVVFHDMGGGGVAATEDQFMTMEVFDNKNGRTYLTNQPDLVVQGYFHRRGQATFWNPKPNLRVETQDEYGANLNVDLLGMPAENDWVFYAIDVYDKVLMHNPLSHQLYRDMGHYTSRTRYCEVFLKVDAGTPGPITSSDYFGLYVLEEKPKIDKNRIDIDKLQPENTTLPTISGGYLFSIDKSNPEMQDWLAGLPVYYLDPDFAALYVPSQVQYVEDYFNNFYNALYGSSWTDPTLGYAPYIDMSSWIDFHLHQTFVFNADALRISTFFYKPRNGPVVQGPLWDFDRAFGTGANGDQRGFNPRRWRSSSMDGGTDYFNPGNTFSNPWYGRMFNDPDFWQKWIDRYQELRKNVYRLDYLMAKIDGYANEVREATSREYARWRGGGDSDTSPRSGTISGDGLTYAFPVPGTWQGEVDYTKYWFSNRVAFMDGQFLNPPVFSSPGGAISPGYALSLVANTAETNSTIFYTLDGRDPRLPGGALRPGALSATNAAAITLNGNARVFARNFNAAHRNLTGANNPPLSSSWSGPTVATFYTATPPLRITELMYNPPLPPAGNTNNNDNFEYIEFQNTGGLALNLVGYALSGGVNFTFGNYTVGAGQYVLLVRNLAAFQSRYPGVTNIAGVFTNSLANAGEHLVLTGPLQEPVLDFSFNDSWYPTTDGLGFSLVVADGTQATSLWNSPVGWRPSSTVNGSPGLADPAPPPVSHLLITEALTHTDPPQVDTIELFNPTTNWVDLGRWCLTDDRHVPAKFRIQPGTLVSPGGYRLFTTNDFGDGTNGFALSSTGDEVYLFSSDSSSNLTGYAHGFSFGPAPNGVSFGRYVNSQTEEFFVLQSTNTLGTNNSYPRMGPVVISEIMYHLPDPYAGADDPLGEYIELSNISGTNVPLYDVNARTNTWHLRKAVDFDFPTNVSLPAAGRLLLVGFDPARYPVTRAAFASRYGVPVTVPIYGPWTGKLNNAEDSIQLERPDNPNVTPTNVFVPYYLVEQVHYGDVAPWPTNADGGGAALQRLQTLLFGNEPTNWVGVAPFTGKPALPSVGIQPTNVLTMTGSNITFVTTIRGSDPLTCQWYFNLTNPIPWGRGPILTLTNVQVVDAGSYHLRVDNGYGTATSQVATLTVVAAPMIVSQPDDQIVSIGANAEFEVGVAGAGLTYRWYYNTNTLLPGNAPNLLLFGVQPLQAGTYHVVISNPYGSVTSRFAVLTVLTPPTILTQPTNLTVTAGENATFTLGASGSAPLSFQWYQNTTNALAAGTNSALAIPSAQWIDSGAYQAVVANAAGAATSAVAVLRVLVPPVIGQDSLTIGADGVSISVQTLAGLSYQLEYKNSLTDSSWTPLAPALPGTGSTLTLTDASSPRGSIRFYRVRSY